MQRPILVTGGSGQLATALARGAHALTIRRVGRPAFDFDRPESIEAAFAGGGFAAVVNAAAYTGVDAAETDPAAAFRANRDGPARLAGFCGAAGIPLIHVSTDYVFDGSKGAPYVESDPTAPLGVYGASKLAGEEAVLGSGARAIVLRSSWVISATGRNFVRTMIALSQKADRLSVVADQRGRPTSAADLGAAIITILRRIEAVGWQDRFGGVFHATGSGETTWHGLAVAVFEEASRHGLTPPTIMPITTQDWPTPARRPADSRLDCGHLAAVFGIHLPFWQQSLRPIIDELLGGAAR